MELAPNDKIVPCTSPGNNKLYLAKLGTLLTNTQLVQAPPSTGFLPSDGVPISSDGSVATHSWDDTTRQSILSADWVHKSHDNPVRSWKVRASRATYDSGDIYFGLTQSSSFELPGVTIVFDLHGNFRYGWHPLKLLHTHVAEDLNCLPGSKKFGSFVGNKNSPMEIVADIANQFMILKLEDGSEIRYPLEGWEHARLCVTLSCKRDKVELVK